MAYTNIDDPSAYFQTTTYTGNGANTEVTNSGNSDLKPDFLWIKNRTAGYGHFVVDSNRNISYAQNSSNAPYLETESTAAENNNQNWMASVNTNGFTTGISEHINNNSGSAFVAWQWKANGGTTASNTDGTITSTVQFNSDAGFSIQTFTSASSGNSNWGHGLGVTPDVFIVKRRDGTSSWWGHWKGTSRTAGSGNNWQYMGLNSTAAATSLSTFKADSTTITTSNDFVPNSASMVCYAFAEKQGYSKFGKYVGNGSSTNGTFVYTGFKPAWVMVKRTDGVTNWRLFDSKRSGFNADTSQLYPNLANAEDAAGDQIDLLSNGFKNRTASGDQNISGASYIYMAFAENPFVTSTGVPTTAR